MSPTRDGDPASGGGPAPSGKAADAGAPAPGQPSRAAYRIFEHPAEETCALRLLGWLLSGAAAQALAYGAWRPGPAGPERRASEAGLVPSALLLAVVSSLVASVASLFAAGPGPHEPRPERWQAHALALAILGCHLGLLAACRAVPAEPSEAPAAPGGLEAAAVALLAVEALLDTDFRAAEEPPPGGPRRKWTNNVGNEVWEPGAQPADATAHAAMAAALVGISWVLRCYPAEGAAADAVASAAAGLLRRCGSAFGCALCFALAARRAAASAGRAPAAPGGWPSVPAAAHRAVRLSGLYAGAGLALVAAAQPWGEAGPGPPADPGQLPRLAGAGAAGAWGLLSLLGVASCASPAFAARAAAFAWAGCALAGGQPGHQWLAACGMLLHLGGLAARNRDRLRRAGATRRFEEVPPHAVGAQALWDRARCTVGVAIWRATILQWARIANAVLPTRLSAYCCSVPLPDLGVPLGIAAHYQPRWVKEQHPKVPGHLVCNVGQIGASALGDIQKTYNNLVDVWREFRDPQMSKGLLTNCVAVFPYTDNNGETVAKEINLSAWESGKDAFEWYVRSPGHRMALKMHSSGMLQTFGNLLASLDPDQPIVHRDRCRHCSRVVEGVAGTLAPAQCGFCGGPAFGYPTF